VGTLTGTVIVLEILVATTLSIFAVSFGVRTFQRESA